MALWGGGGGEQGAVCEEVREGGREGGRGRREGRRISLFDAFNQQLACPFALTALFDSLITESLVDLSQPTLHPSFPSPLSPSLPLLRRNPFMDIRPDEKGAQFFIRQKTKEAQGVIDQTYKKGKAERDLIVERMNARRAARMAGEGYNRDSASAGGGSCAIS